MHELRDPKDLDLLATLDPQWLDLAVQLEDLDLVQTLAVPGRAKANDLLWKHFQQRLAQCKDDFELHGILDTMVRVGHPEATDAVIELIKRTAKANRAYGYHALGDFVSRLPKAEAVPKLEALLPTLPEKIIDQLHDYVTQLKSSP